MIDLVPSAVEVARLAGAVREDDLDRPTPCAGTSVAALLHHLLGLTLAFRDAARKATDGANTGPGGIAPNTELPADWREPLSRQHDDLAAAWQEPSAWEGQTVAGGVTLPAAEMGVVALDELVLHGWDLARAVKRQVCDQRRPPPAVREPRQPRPRPSAGHL